MNTATRENNETSAVFSMSELEYPKLGSARVESAIMGYGVIAQDKGYFYVVWWDGDEPQEHMLTWIRCDECDVIHQGDLECYNCIEEATTKVA